MDKLATKPQPSGKEGRKKGIMTEITKITSEQATEIIETRKPLGMFYLIENGGVYVGIDNRCGDAWTEDFKSLGVCKRWLLN